MRKMEIGFLGETANVPTFGHLSPARARLQHLLTVASTLTNSDVAAIVLVHKGASRVIACTNHSSIHTTFKWQDDHIPYAIERSHILTKVTDLELARAIRVMLGSYRTGTLIRIPVLLQPQYNIAMLLHTQQKGPIPNKHDITVLQAIAKAAISHSQQLAEEVVGVNSNVNVSETFEEIVASILADNDLRVLLNAETEVLATSRGFKSLALQGTDHPKAFAAVSLLCTDSFFILARAALESGASSPEAEISLKTPAGAKLVTMRINPIQPKDIDSDFLEVAMQLVDDGQTAAFQHETSTSAAQENYNSTEKFLMDTLVYKRSLRSRDATSFMTIRTWRTPIKKYQIDALRAIKSQKCNILALAAGLECASELQNLIGLGAYKYVIPVPCGHSPPHQCFSSALARVIGNQLGLPVINAFAHLEQLGSSHPKSNLSRSNMRLIQHVPGPAILVDDVATSGSHLTEACNVLRLSGVHSFAMAWIGGNS